MELHDEVRTSGTASGTQLMNDGPDRQLDALHAGPLNTKASQNVF